MENLNMAKQNKVAVNLAQDFTDAEKAQARSNIGAGTANVHIITTDYSTPILGDAAFAELESAVNNNEEVLIKVGMTSAAIYYKLAVVSGSEYRFESHTASGLSTLTINRTTKSKTFNNKNIGLPTVTSYNASFGNSWNSMRKIDSSISSGVTIKEVTLSSPISLSAGKKYLITPIGLIGNVEQTKMVSETINVSYSLRIWLCDSTKSMLNNSTAVILGEAEIANHNVASLGQYPPVNGVYRGSFAPTDAIIEPTQDLSLDTLRICNGGNIDFGFSSSNPAILVIDARIVGINIMEIQ